MTSPVIDISHHNPTPDWAEIKQAGVVGVILKCTEGTTYVDDTWLARATDALVAGLGVATYHFLRPGSMSEQIGHYIAEQDKLMPLGSRVVLDHEDDGVSLNDLVACVEAIMATRPDLQIAVYSGHLIKDQLGAGYNDVLAKNTSLWIAHYTSTDAPSWPQATWPLWSLWQWTDSETIAGISAPVDGDRWNGDEAGLREWFRAVEAPGPPVQMQTVVYRLTITAPPGDVSIEVEQQPCP